MTGVLVCLSSSSSKALTHTHHASSLYVSVFQHVDGAGKVDGSCVVALPMEKGKEFAGGGLTFWDGKTTRRDHDSSNNGQVTRNQPDEIHYDTRAGDLAFIDRYVR